jgi:hypothetical protein
MILDDQGTSETRHGEDEGRACCAICSEKETVPTVMGVRRVSASLSEFVIRPLCPLCRALFAPSTSGPRTSVVRRDGERRRRL